MFMAWSRRPLEDMWFRWKISQIHLYQKANIFVYQNFTEKLKDADVVTPTCNPST